MSYEGPYWTSELTHVKVTGKFLTDLDVKLRVGEFPEISFVVYLEALIESLPKEVFEKLHKHMTHILIDNVHIGVRKIPIHDAKGNLIGEMWSEVV